MKLRNKKTGEIFYPDDWEAFEPKEPLIKDKKIRKAVKAWAEALMGENDDLVNCYGGKEWIGLRYERPSTSYTSRFEIDSSATIDNNLEYGKMYTIAELCGEEEE